MRISAFSAFTLAVGWLVLASGPAAADEAGERAFKKHCATCHTVDAGKNRVGPSLHGVVGRKAGQVAGFKYSDANANSGVTLDQAYLEKYLTDPKAAMPGNKMLFNGVKNDQERRAIIAYLSEHK